MEKKIYLKDLTDEKVLALFKGNNDLKQIVFNDMIDNNNFWQNERFEEFFSRNCNSCGVIYIDNYSSFYLKINDYNKFFNTFNENNLDYLDEVAREYYKYMIDNKDCYNMLIGGYDEEEIVALLGKELNMTIEEYESNCDKLLDEMEKELHTFEESPTTDDVVDYFQNSGMYEDLLEKLYITDESVNIIYEDINYTNSYM